MRLFPAFFGAMVISLLIFLFMQNLIARGRDEPVALTLYQNVDIVPRQEEPPPDEEEPEPQTLEEPTLEPLAVAAVTPPVPEPAALDIAALDLGVGDIKFSPAGKRWSAPMGIGEVKVEGGTDGRGYIEVVPYDTRRPNVPEVAWQNKIDGWVLVAFSVTKEGKTRDARVLDAMPRGVFEEKVLAAVADWTYRLNFIGKATGNVVLTQKVEVLWKNFPQNLPNVD